MKMGKVDMAKAEYNNLRRFAGERYPKGKCTNILELFQVLNGLIDVWLEWNEKKIDSHDFCMAFEKRFRKDIRERIKQHQSLKEKILRQMVREK